MVLVAVVLLIQLSCRRWLPARWTYILWLLVAARLILPVAPESSFSLSNLYTGIPKRRAELPPRATPLLVVPTAISPVPAPAKPATRFTARVVLAGTWLFGAAAYLLCCLLHYRRVLKWARRQPALCHPRLLTLLRSAQEILGYHRPVKLLVTESLTVPSVLGVIRPCLLIPQQMIATWSDEELRLAILHELVHVCRRDNVMNWALIGTQALHWFNPVVWFALRRLRSEREALCDAIVLSHLRGEERQSYGAVLIKAAEQITSTDISPALVPIINHKHEVKRRIRMISRFKPTPRTISICAAAIVIALLAVTFTGAAQKEKKTAPRIADAKKEQQTKQYEQGMKILDAELDRINHEIQATERRMDQLRLELGIPSYIAQGDGNAPGPETETIRRLQVLKVDATSEYQHLADLYKQLTTLSRRELRNAIPLVTPDQQLGLLFERFADAEQKLASLTERYAPEHLEVAALKHTMDKIRQQIEEREDGVLAGLKAKTESSGARVAQISAELEKKVARDVDAPIRYRPYFNTKRELESLLIVRNRLQERLVEEKLNAALPRESPRSEKSSDGGLSAP